MEDCVNAVGVDVNTASPALLASISGLSQALAPKYRGNPQQAGPVPQPGRLEKSPKLGPKAFEQCAGFLRVANGTNPAGCFRRSPGAYPVVKRILEASRRRFAR